MAERGEMALDDPAAKYLPASVKLPTYHGSEITLRDLMKETSGLPDFYDALNPKRADDFLADFTLESMDAFVSSCQLTVAPGTKHFHAGVDLGLLEQALAMKGGTDYESLMVDRVLRPLNMDSTRFALGPEMISRLATEHDEFGFGYPLPRWNWGVLNPLAGLHSTANDLLKFVSVNLGLTPSRLTSLMERSRANLTYAPPIEGIVHTGGGGFGGRIYVGIDKARRRGVVVLSTVDDSGRDLGNFLLESEWQSDRRPTASQISSQAYRLYPGQYRRSSDFALGMFAIRRLLPAVNKAVVYIPIGFCFVMLGVVLRRTRSPRKRRIILGCTVLVGSLLPPLVVLASSRIFCAKFEPDISIRREGDRLIAQATGLNLCPIKEWKFRGAWGDQSNPIDVLFPRVATELLPESETQFFDRLSGVPILFSRGAQGNVIGLTAHYRGQAVSYDKISNQQPEAPVPPKRPVGINLDTRLLDACVGHYESAPNPAYPTGMKLRAWRENDQMLVQAWGKNILKGAIDIYPESETTFFDKIYGVRLTFIKNDKGAVTAVIRHQAGLPDCEAKMQN